jgi:predicted adenylyl cyclase CyaB
MAENIEIKARCGDLRKAARIARRLGARRLGVEWQRDTYFALSSERARRGARFKLRERKGGAQLIPYVRPTDSAPKRSQYLIIPVRNPRTARALLSDILGVAAVVEKRRTIFLLDNVRIHLDRVRGLGTFIEFEAVVGKGRAARAQAQEQVKHLMSEFGISRADLLPLSYAEMM